MALIQYSFQMHMFSKPYAGFEVQLFQALCLKVYRSFMTPKGELCFHLFSIYYHYHDYMASTKEENLRLNLGKNIRHHRKLKQLTQYELSIQVDVSERYIKMLEKGANSPSMAVLCMLSETLGVEPYELLK